MPPERLQTIFREAASVVVLDQALLPHTLRQVRLATAEEAARAIRDMQVRGAPLIGATAAYGVALAMQADSSDAALARALALLAQTRPTAVNLRWALARMREALAGSEGAARVAAAWREAEAIHGEDAAANAAIGRHGLALLRPLCAPGRALRVMTHCNAGWLATTAWGTALAPIYLAHEEGLALEITVSETRPRNQGLLTAWELEQAGVPYRLIADNAAGLLLARGEIDAVIVGADRIAANGDVANKIGTYLKALAAREAGVPFYVAAPESTLDFGCPAGIDIPIEQRDGDELRLVHGSDAKGAPGALRIAAPRVRVANPAFDVTPARLVSRIVTEHGACAPDALRETFPERAHG